jgi:hypothetical protein
VPNSVRFCCPHCRQAYYGTSEKGHLVPRTFDCVNCDRRVDMDEMVLFPAEGVDEEQTNVGHMPWLQRRRRGWPKAWLSTVGQALIAPPRLMRAVPESSSVGQAWWFAFVTAALIIVASFLPLLGLTVAVPFMVSGAAGGAAGAPGPVRMAAIITGFLALAMIVGLALLMLLMVIWGLVTHALLSITGKGHGSIGRTFQAICYSSGANVTTAIPCFGQYIGFVWWLISAVLMIREAHRVHGGRATFAVLALPGSLVLLVVGLYAALAVHMFVGAGPFAFPAPATSIRDTQIVLEGVRAYAAQHEGRGPAHAVELVASQAIAEGDLVGWNTLTEVVDIAVADVTLDELMFLPPPARDRASKAAADSLPAGTVAHRLGDFVFTYHGVDLGNGDPSLWVVVWSPDPDINPYRPASIPTVIGRADGTVATVPLAQFASTLSKQNELRATVGLPPLPHPATVTHDAPAVADGAP